MVWAGGTQKNDLHKHFGGSITPETVHGLLADQNHTLETIKERMLCTTPVATFPEFLAKFDILNEVKWTEKALETCIEQVVRRQADDDVDYSEISFSLDKYMDNHVKWTRPELIKFAYDVFKTACNKYNTEVSIILSLRMEANRDKQLINASLINRSDVAELIGGIDLVGDESKLHTDFYAPICKDWRSAKKLVLVHAGETCGSRNVFDAITQLGAHRIRHGIAAAKDPEVIAAAKDLGVCFDVSLHSNLLAGTVPGLRDHHLPKLLAAGCNVTLGTDDPEIFQCCLNEEYVLACRFEMLGTEPDDVKRNIAVLRANSVKFAGYSL